MNATLRRAALTVVAVLAATLSVPAADAAPTATSTAPASAADAYALDVDVKLVNGAIPIDNGPRARSSQEFPPQGLPQEAEELGFGPVPAGGEVVNKVSILGSGANATGDPAAMAIAYAEDIELLNQAGVPLITAEALVAASTTDCVNAPSAVGTEIVNLRVAGVEDPVTNPAPNTEVAAAVFNPLGLRVIANEQHPTADGRGLVVNALHIYNYNPPAVPVSLFVGDIIVSHAMSTVNCPNGAPSTGDSNPIFIVKNADKAKAKAGDTVTYTATIMNKAAEACPVNQVIDHLPSAFTFSSTSGTFGTTATTVNRDSGGQDVIIKPVNVVIPAGGSATQTYVVTAKGDAQPGTYFNNVEILCGNLGNWVKGLDAPVEIVTEDDTPPPPAKKAQCEDGKDNDGDGVIDFPADPGCTSKKDNSEVNEHPRTGGRDLGGYALLLMLGAYVVRRRMATL